MYNGDRLAPVPLAGEHPVTQLEVHLAAANSLFFQIFLNLFLCVVHGEAVQNTGIYHNAGGAVGVGFLLHVAALDHLHNGEAELFGEFPVPGVVAGHRHNGAGTVAGEHIVGNVNGDFLPVYRVDRGHALQPDACFLFGHLGALKVGFAGGGLLISLDLLLIFQQPLPFFQQGMLWGNHHVGNAVEGVGPGGVHGELVAGGGGKVHLCAGGTANPVFLLGLHPLRVVHQIQVVDEAVGILGDFQHPLGLHLVHHRAAAALAHAVHHFLVGQHAFAGGTPVHGHLFLVGQTMLEQLQEDPLGPLVIVRVCGIDFPGPVEGDAQGLDLLLEAGNVLLRHLSRMHMVFDGVIFGGQAEGVPPDGVQHVPPFQAALAGHNVKGGVRARVPHVKALAGGVGKLYQGEEFRLVRLVGGMEHPGFFPAILPLFFHQSVVVLFTLHALSLLLCYFSKFKPDIG